MGISYLTLLSNSNLLNLSYHNAKAFATDSVGSADAQKSSAARRGCDDSDRRWRAAARHRRSESLRPQTNFPPLPATRQPRTKIPLVYPCEPLCGLLRGRVASPAPEEDFEPVLGKFEQTSYAPKAEQEKGIDAFFETSGPV